MPGEAPSSGQFLGLSELAALNQKRDLLKEQMEQARALGQPQGRKYATWGGALAGGLGDLLGGIAGQTKEARIAEALAANQKAKQGALTGFNEATGQARTALSAAETMPAGPERESALAKAIGGLEDLGLQAQSTGDEAARTVGGGLLQFARDARQEPTRALERTLKQSEIAKQTLEQKELNDPASARTRQAYGLAKKFNIDVPEGATAAQILPLLPLGEKAWETEQEQLAKKTGATDAATKRQQDVAEGLRKEFVGNPVVKATQEVVGSYQKMKTAAAKPTAAGDMSIIVSYMKMLDPGSTVREGEYATAQNAGSVDQRIIGMYNAAVNGKKLAPNVRQDFVGQAANLMSSQLERYRPLAREYGRLAQEAGLGPASVVLDLGIDAGEQPNAGESPDKRARQDARMLELARQGKSDDAIMQQLKAEGLL